MPRYIAALERNGKTVLGTNNILIREYANDRNALRYMHLHLRANHHEPGQYRVSIFDGPNEGRFVGHLYKMA